jgi:phage terminase small subunit
MYLPLVNPDEVDRERLGAVFSPQRVLFVSEYIKTNDVTQAAQTANLELVEAQQVLVNKPRWFTAIYRNLTRDSMLDVAEAGMSEILNLPIKKIVTKHLLNDDGETIDTIQEEVIDKDVLKVKADMIKYATSTLGKDAYSTRTEEHNTTVTVNISQKLKELEELSQGRDSSTPIEGEIM